MQKSNATFFFLLYYTVRCNKNGNLKAQWVIPKDGTHTHTLTYEYHQIISVYYINKTNRKLNVQNLSLSSKIKKNIKIN